METTKDILIKEEENFATVYLNTKKSIEVIENDSNYSELKKRIYGIKVKKFDIDLESKKQILIWAISHNLTLESEGKITV
jgi:hypothetical protein